MKAEFSNTLDGDSVECYLCPHRCRILEGKTGMCKVRSNSGGELIAETFEKYSAINFDPIEKKPLYHYYPGKEILSLGSVGCNMRCKWCQNCEISQTGVHGSRELIHMSADKIIQLAVQKPHNIGVAFTYNEPSISFESIWEVGTLIHNSGLKNVMVTNGYIGKEAMEKYLDIIDAFNVDVKGFENSIHQEYTGAPLQNILDNLRIIHDAEKHLEITYLLVPGVNDDFKKFGQFVRWIGKYLGEDIVFHLSRYFPKHKMKTKATPPFMLEEFANLAANELNFVYVGNHQSSKHQHTICSSCNTVAIRRIGFSVAISGEQKDGYCSNCNKRIYITD